MNRVVLQGVLGYNIPCSAVQRTGVALRRTAKVEQEDMFCVYVIYNKEASKYYVGQTEDIDFRLRQHNEHTFKSYTSRFPGRWELIHSESLPTRSEALKREKGLKSGRGREYIKSIIPA